MMVAGVFATLATMSFAEVITDAEGRRYYRDNGAGAVQLTFLANDSTNVSAYAGCLEVPAAIALPGSVKGEKTEVPVDGVTAYGCVFCSALDSVILPEGLTRIGYSAFADCTSLQSITLPSTLTSLGDWAFYHDSALSQIDVPAATARLGACSFAFDTQLGEVSLAPGLRSIAQQAFYYCSSIEEITLPWTINQIGQYAFAYCTRLKRIVVGSSPVAITPDVFEGVDVSACTLVVPSDQVFEYASADVWRDFIIEDGGFNSLDEVTGDEESLFDYRVEESALVINVKGDAPALVYNLMGQRIAVVAPQHGETSIPLTRAYYIIRCGKEMVKISVEN